MSSLAVARLGDRISHGGAIISASHDVFCDGQGVARIGDDVICTQHGNQTIITGCDFVRVNGREIATMGSMISCGATVSSASPTVFVGDVD